MKSTKLITLMAAVAAALTFTHAAHAREHRYRYRMTSAPRYFNSAPATYQTTYQAASQTWGASAGASTNYAGYGGRPRAWCGWQMRQLVDADPGPQFNLARSWAHWGHPGPAGIGAVVVWAHHVGKIVGQENGQWIIQSGNDGNRVRTRPLSVSGAIAFRWG